MSKLAEELFAELESLWYGYSGPGSKEAKTKVIECIDKALAKQREACAKRYKNLFTKDNWERINSIDFVCNVISGDEIID